MKPLKINSGRWLHEPSESLIDHDAISIVTQANTDFWQRTYYGFRNHNAPAYLFSETDNFTFTVKVEFVYTALFDQCGIIIMLDSENWFKASIEFENKTFSRLGSVVTNLGYSDWATRDIKLPQSIWYRLHRRGPDFLVESSQDGIAFSQMRVFHLHSLGQTTEEMGKLDPPLPSNIAIDFGVYACSPSQSSFTAKFSDFSIQSCRWRSHA